MGEAQGKDSKVSRHLACADVHRMHKHCAGKSHAPGLERRRVGKSTVACHGGYWVPACAGTTRGWASIGRRNTTHHSRHPSPSFPRRRESRIHHSVGRGSHSPTTINALSPSPRCGALPGSPPARGRRGDGRQSGGGIRHTTRGTPPRHSRAGGNPGFTTAWGGGVTLQPRSTHFHRHHVVVPCLGPRLRGDDAGMGVNRAAQYDTPLAVPHPVISAQVGIQDSPQRGAGESLTNHDQRTFTVTTLWCLAWVPARAGTTRGKQYRAQHQTVGPRPRGDDAGVGVNRVAEYDTPLAAPHPVIPAQAGIQDSPQRGAGKSLTNHDQRTFTVTTLWCLAWVPACAGTTPRDVAGRRKMGRGPGRIPAVHSPASARYLVSMYSARPWLEPSRPTPDNFTPPNGATSVEIIPVLTPTMPYSSCLDTRQTRPWSFE